MRLRCLLHVCSDVPVPRGSARQRTAVRLGRLRISRQHASVKTLVDLMNRTPERRALNLRAHWSSCRVPMAMVLTQPVARSEAYGRPLIPQPDLRQPTGHLAHSGHKRASQPRDPARHRRRYTAGTAQVHHQSTTGCAARIIDWTADVCLRQHPERGDGWLAGC
jgi:hypothetical protein